MPRKMSHPKEISVLTTAIATALLVLLLTCTNISWQPQQPWPPEPTPYIELDDGTEYIEPQILPAPTTAPQDLSAAALTPEYSDAPSKAAPQSGASHKTTPSQGTPAREVTANRPSEVKEKPTPKPDDAGSNAEQKERQATARRTQNSVKNAFAKPDAKNNANNRDGDRANAGNPKGNPDSAGPANSNATASGVRTGKIGGGWQWPAYSVNIKTHHTGTVVVSITINADGTATAKATGGTPPAASDPKLCAQCEKIATSRRFTRPASAGDPPQRASATLTFVFE